MATIAVYFDQPGGMDYPFTDALYLDSYRRFTEEAARSAIRIVIVRGEASHQQGTTFSHYWEFTNGTLTAVDKTITADLIYNKCVGPLPTNFPPELTVNHPELDHICHDKLTTYQYFSEFMAKSLPITAQTWREAVVQLRTEMVTLKPVEGESGEGIVFVEKATFNGDEFNFNQPYLAQEFIDTSKGIPGITSGRHDLRVVVFNGEPKLAYIRIPVEGSLLANVALGATTQTVDITQVPESVHQMVASVDAKLKQFSPRIYSIDFLVAGTTPFIVELNSRPGFPNPKRQGVAFSDTFFSSLISILSLHLKTITSQDV
ncbi:hypothetical protein BH11PAT4_BH11PAT4_0380 [soil metagenome]